MILFTESGEVCGYMNDRKPFGGMMFLAAGAAALLLTVFVVAPNSGTAADAVLNAVRRGMSAESITVKNMSSGKEPTSEAAAEEATKALDSVAAALSDGDAQPSETDGADESGEYETPSDIAAMRDEYVAVFAEAKPQGKVTECFFTTNGATVSVGNVHIKNTTSKTPDFASLLKDGVSIDSPDLTKPTVLIFHTHTTESYLMADNGVFYSDYQTRSEDPSRNMVRVGDEICKRLKEAGIGVIHDTNIYDATYNGAYARSRKTVLEYLEKYPSIKVVLDVHRDAVYTTDTDHLKPVCEINGKKSAQVMIITGADGGPVASFPHWEDNLKFALALQKRVQSEYEGLMKPVYFCNRRYNMDVTPCSLLLEFGSDANTLDEAVYAASMLGASLGRLITESAAK